MDNKVNSSKIIENNLNLNNQDEDYQYLLFRLKSIKESIILLEKELLAK